LVTLDLSQACSAAVITPTKHRYWVTRSTIMSSSPPVPLTHPLHANPPSAPPESPDTTLSPFSSPDDLLVTPQQQRQRKGKEKEAVGEEDEEQEVGDEDDASFVGDKEGGEETSAEYPPVNDEEAETRRVEEVQSQTSPFCIPLKPNLTQNLRQWEVAERERRKAARESLIFTRPPSFVDDLTQFLWPGRSKSTSSSSTGGRRGGDPALGKHTVLQSQENLDVVPMDTIPPSPTPTLSIVSPRPSMDPSYADPFLSPIDDAASTQIQPHSPALMSEFSPESPTTLRSAEGPQTEVEADSRSPTTTIPLIRIPPPGPLDLPSPRTPPPRTDTSPPPAAASIRSPNGEAGAVKPTRWWHEWLCGCGEGPDRGGEDQVRSCIPFAH
jgi:hypothetical protein